jgi:hypothetical protein
MHVIGLTPDEFTVFLNLFEVDLKNNGGRNGIGRFRKCKVSVKGRLFILLYLVKQRYII